MPVRRPILRSCCCWRSLTIGSYASGAYTMMYFTVTASMMISFVHEERAYLLGNQTAPKSNTFLESETITESTVVFNLVLLVCSILGIISTLMLFVGIYKRRRCLLFPWMLMLSVDILIEFVHCGHMFILETLNFNPITAILFTMDFFVVVIHLYSLLCVISLYQEIMLMSEISANADKRTMQLQQMNEGASKLQGAIDFHSMQTQSSRHLNETSTLLPGPPSLVSPSHKSTNPAARKKVQFPDETPIKECASQAIDK